MVLEYEMTVNLALSFGEEGSLGLFFFFSFFPHSDVNCVKLFQLLVLLQL